MAEVEEVAGAVVAEASAPGAVVAAVGVAVVAVVALELSNMPTRHISTPQSLDRSRLQ